GLWDDLKAAAKKVVSSLASAAIEKL
uniref:Aggression-stimulating peptide n=1 Tax=Leptodactylus fallax TaxID=375434 RepID=AGSP1_LEPFX|nr:RecName: Full=Aggression-stimulating peptide; AltName: Full=LASP [Leptodactylus fallax]